MLRTRVALARPAKTFTDISESSVACHPRMKTAKISQYQRWLTVQKPIQPIHLLHIRRHIVLVRHLPLNKLQVQMTKIPKKSPDQKDIVWYYHGSCMPKTLLWSKAILFGGSTWLSECVRALHFPLLGFEAGLERENAWNYWDIFYEGLLQVTFDIWTGNTEDGWKKHGINRQPFFWFGTPSNKIMTKIPKESANQKDIVWYYHGSCMPKTLLWSKAILLGGSTWLRKRWV